MVFLFGIKDQVSVIMNERYLTKEEQARATLVLEELPEPEIREGYYSIIYIDPQTKEFSYKYRPNETETE